jgi:hypothetical protein
MKRHLRLVPLVGVLFLLVALIGALDAKPLPKNGNDEKTPNYYPIEVGNQWHFRVTVGDNSTTAISTIAKTETIDGVTLSRLEATINGKIIATEHLSQTAKGVFRYRNNGQEISPPICLLKYPAKSGTKWDGDITVGTEKGKYACEAKEENIEVAAGKFKAMRVAIKIDSQGKTVNTTYWFVPEIGFVKQTVETGGLNIVMELEKYERAKKKEK